MWKSIEFTFYAHQTTGYGYPLIEILIEITPEIEGGFKAVWFSDCNSESFVKYVENFPTIEEMKEWIRKSERAEEIYTAEEMYENESLSHLECDGVVVAKTTHKSLI